ncbi:hypothetical protein CYMTET_26593 [Cymbomonas tetramitiformis]|uniref:Uncharacterized protein n=1 Tax=Cymbomonas tetramitiformis TaxID=36881 RepID=A0AAE0FRP9_9CHLO|nr:hypothetical protein CYMTET_26593 [Cymbomonas tetramitiformis]
MAAVPGQQLSAEQRERCERNRQEALKRKEAAERARQTHETRGIPAQSHRHQPPPSFPPHSASIREDTAQATKFSCAPPPEFQKPHRSLSPPPQLRGHQEAQSWPTWTHGHGQRAPHTQQQSWQQLSTTEGLGAPPVRQHAMHSAQSSTYGNESCPKCGSGLVPICFLPCALKRIASRGVCSKVGKAEQISTTFFGVSKLPECLMAFAHYPSPSSSSAFVPFSTTKESGRLERLERLGAVLDHQRVR